MILLWIILIKNRNNTVKVGYYLRFGYKDFFNGLKKSTKSKHNLTLFEWLFKVCKCKKSMESSVNKNQLSM